MDQIISNMSLIKEFYCYICKRGEFFESVMTEYLLLQQNTLQ